MEHNIGVGVIVGILTALLIYMFRYFRDYRLIQKFKKTNRLLQTQGELFELRNSGILTEDEFDSRKRKISEEIDFLTLKETNDYRSLVKLKNKGLFSDQQFNEKATILALKYSSKKAERKNGCFYTDNMGEFLIHNNIEIRFYIKFIDDHHSFKIGNFKAWNINLEESKTLKFYTKNSNGKYFTMQDEQLKYFDTKLDFITYIINLKL